MSAPLPERATSRDVTPIDEIPAPLLAMLAVAIRRGSAPRGGTVRLRLIDGDRDGYIQVGVEEARRALGMD